MLNTFKPLYFYAFIILILFITIVGSTTYYYKDEIITNANEETGEITYTISNTFAWPVPGYNRISSNYGYRNKPTERCFIFSLWD